MVKLLLPEIELEAEEENEVLRDAVFANIAQLLDQIPRGVEFTYNPKRNKLKPLFVRSMVPYTTLLNNLHLPKAQF